MYMTHHLITSAWEPIHNREFTGNAHQPVVVYFHSWAVVSPKYKS